MNKLESIAIAVSKIKDGDSLMVGGFMGVGAPSMIIDEIVRQGIKNLCLITSDTASPNRGVGKLIDNGLVRKVVASHIGTNSVTQELMMNGSIEVELFPQGTLAEKIRSGGSGIAGFLVRTGTGTLVAEGKDTLNIDGIEYLLEKSITADHSILFSEQADVIGNLKYRLAAGNFNPVMAMASKNVIAEAREIVPLGSFDPDEIHTPSCFIDSVVSGTRGSL